MRLRTRLAAVLLALITVFSAVLIVTLLSVARASIYEATDNVIESQAVDLIEQPLPPTLVLVQLDEAARANDPLMDQASATRLQLIDPFLDITAGDPAIPNDGIAASATSDPTFRNVEIDGHEFRVFTAKRADGRIIQAAASSEPIVEGLQNLRRTAIAIAALTVVAAASLGWIIAGRFTKPIVDVAAATPLLAGDAARPLPIEATGRTDEVGDLVTNFNALIAALRESDARQERLVADASHELRSPLTSLRVKIDFLHNEPGLDEATRIDIVRGAAEELESLTRVVSELVTLARREEPDDPLGVVLLRDVVNDVAERMQQSAGREISVVTDESVVQGRQALIRRAVTNLVDNAVKFSPTATAIEIRQQRGRIEVRDHGPGIDLRDREKIFERFYRAAGSHDVPGSGIGLAIVQKVAEDHGGDVWVEDAPGGGVTVGFSLSETPA